MSLFQKSLMSFLQPKSNENQWERRKIMKKRKSQFAIVLLCIAALLLTACGGSTKENDGAGDSGSKKASDEKLNIFYTNAILTAPYLSLIHISEPTRP